MTEIVFHKKISHQSPHKWYKWCTLWAPEKGSNLSNEKSAKVSFVTWASKNISSNINYKIKDLNVDNSKCYLVNQGYANMLSSRLHTRSLCLSFSCLLTECCPLSFQLFSLPLLSIFLVSAANELKVKTCKRSVQLIGGKETLVSQVKLIVMRRRE